MNPVLHPVGRNSSSVYWRRRIAVLLLLAVVALVVYLLLRTIVGQSPAASADGPAGSPAPAATTPAVPVPSESAAEPTPSAPPSPTATATDGAAPCVAASLQVTTTADATVYPSDGQAEFGLVARNVGDAPCSLDAGSAAVEYEVVSGSDRIWSSDDCQTDPVSDVQMVPAGAELQSSVVWELERSAPGCTSDLPDPRSGTYQVVGRIGEHTSEPLVFTID